MVLDGRVLGRKPEGIPSHRMQHVVAVHPHVAGQGVADGVVAHVPHVERTRRIGQHLQDVVLLLARVQTLGGIEVGIVVPALGPFLFDGLRIVTAFILLTAGSGGRGDGRLRGFAYTRASPSFIILILPALPLGGFGQTESLRGGLDILLDLLNQLADAAGSLFDHLANRLGGAFHRFAGRLRRAAILVLLGLLYRLHDLRSFNL